MQEYYTKRHVSEGVFTHDFWSFMMRQNAMDEAILLIEKLQGKTVEEKLNIIEENFNRQYTTCLSAVKDHSFHIKSTQQSMFIQESEDLEDRSSSDASSVHNDELVKSMLASNKLIGDMQENMNKIQNQINNTQNKDKEYQRHHQQNHIFYTKDMIN